MNNRLNEAQLEILNLFATPMSDERFKKLKQLLLEFRAEELSELVDTKFAEMGIHPDDLLGEHMRTPYINKN